MSKYRVEVKITQYLYDDPKSNCYSVELTGPNSTVVFRSFKTHKQALKFTERFEFKRPSKKSKKCKVTDFRGGQTLEELMKEAA